MKSCRLLVYFWLFLWKWNYVTGFHIRPNIILILADDMGWNDVSYHGSDQIPTPNIDALAYNGVILNNHYVQPLCSPTRGALMTGKYPIHTGLHSALYPAQQGGLITSEKILPQYLKEIDYTTHIIGKWHLGYSLKEFTPLHRGFDSHFGYWTGAISYYDYIGEGIVSMPPNNMTYSGYDMKRNYTTAWDVVGQYATDLFTSEAVKVIENHSPNKPLFLLLSHLAVHTGNKGKLLEAPQEDINKFSYIANPNRRTYAAMVSKLDQSVGNVLSALERKKMLQNAIIVFSSDNGAQYHGAYCNWGSNHPLKGQKGSLWEGGIKVPAVIWSTFISKPSRVSNDLIHITDWLPTLLSAAGYHLKLDNIDGVNQWDALSKGSPSPRLNMVIDIYESGDLKMSALRIGPFKYIKNVRPSSYYFMEISSRNTPEYNIQEILDSKAWKALKYSSAYEISHDKIYELRNEAKIKCEEKHTEDINCIKEACLFNIMIDPCEQTNIANRYPLLVKHIDGLIQEYDKNSCNALPFVLDRRANPDLYNGTWNIWRI